ncbi:MAG: T9SS type A sorting domain-containing protein [Sphingobacteriales bacterium]|nr:MAG: T9SS type A sorting domain-containing protein [Sphingobacteriales bacterium]
MIPKHLNQSKLTKVKATGKLLQLLAFLLFASQAFSQTISSISPQTGGIGTEVTISGSGFSTTASNNYVSLGGVKAVVNSATSSSLKVIIPQGAVSAPFIVTVSSLSAISRQTFNLTFKSSPQYKGSNYLYQKNTISTGATNYGVATGDLNGDGLPDLIYSTYNGNASVNICLNKGSKADISDTTFATVKTYNTTGYGYDIKVADLTGDGKPEVIVTNYNTSTVTVLQNTSSGNILSLGTAYTYKCGLSPYRLAIGDINGDGKPEIVVTNQTGQSIGILKNKVTNNTINTTSFADAIAFATGGTSRELAINDLDGDGKADIVVCGRSNVISVFRNIITNGDIDKNSLDTRLDLTITGTSNSLAVADFDNDGKPDIAAVPVDASSNADIIVIRNIASSGSLSTSSFETPRKYININYSNIFHINTGDINGDGKTDIILGIGGSYVATMINNHTSGSFSSTSFSTQTFHNTSSGTYSLALGDFNLDGKPDVATVTAGNSKVDLLQNYTQEIFTASDTASDARININWSIPLTCYKAAAGDAVYLELMDLKTNKEIFKQKIDSFPLTQPYLKGSFVHVLDANIAKNYRLNLYRIGPGTVLCDTIFTDAGSTKPFQKPILETVTDDPSLIELKWQNNSDLVSAYKIYRNNKVIAVLDSTQTSFTDKFIFNDTIGPKNGSTYNYCIEVYNNRLKKAYTQVCSSRKMLAINFKASDNTFADKVELSWNKLADFGQMVKIMRDGNFYAQLPSTATSYTDKNPIYGKKHLYQLVLMNENQNTVAVTDLGGVKANGSISGRIVSSTGDYALKGATVTAVIIVEKDTFTRTATADATGRYSFSELYYHAGGNFTLTAKYGNASFEQNPINVRLSKDTFVFANADFKDLTVRTKGTVSISFSSLTATPNPAFDYLTLGWNYTSTDSIYFKIYRDEKLIDLLSTSSSQPLKSYIDYNGTPGKQHEYKVTAYIIRNKIVSENSLTKSASYPVVSVVDTAFATASPIANAGTLSLKWKHTSRNFSGFKIYRNSEWIATLDTNQRTYLDLNGENNKAAVYEFKTFVKRNGKEYESAGAQLKSVTYPPLTAPSNFTVTPNEKTREVVGKWTFSRAKTYNYDGFLVTRKLGSKTDTLTFIDKNFPYSFTDKNASPGVQYSYVVSTYKKNKSSVAAASAKTANFPALTPPTNFAASDGTYDGFIWLTWADTTQNHDGYAVIRNNDTTFVGYGKTQLKHLLATPYMDSKITFRIATYSRINKQLYFSAFVSDDGFSAKNNGTQRAPTNFTASNNYSKHVQLKWQYPAYILATFKILKNGFEIAVLETDQRIFYDYDARPGQTYTYQIQAVYSGNASQKVSANGSVKSTTTLSGNVVSAQGGIGISNATVTAFVNHYSNTYTLRTQTDATGFYKFESLPETDEGEMLVWAEKQNHGFIEDTFKFEMNSQAKNFTANFTDTFQNYIIDNSHIAQPLKIVATPNGVDKTVEIRWNVNSANYTGFKIFRGFGEMADIPASGLKMYTDTSGYPGYTYNYRIQAYWDLPEGRQLSDPIGTTAIYPVVLPVQELQGSADATRDVLNIYWSHPADNHSYYEISRNGKVIGTVKTGNNMKFTDTSALPDNTYIYSVTAVQVINKRIFTSEAVTVNGTFPIVSQATNLTATDGNNNLMLSWSHISKNHSGYKIYRDKILFGTVAANQQTYTDTTGEPGKTYLYEVSPYRNIAGVNYEAKAIGIKKLYPQLVAPYDIYALAQNSADKTALYWMYNNMSGADGFVIYRNNVELEVIKNPATWFAYKYHEDLGGIPNTSYTYIIRAFSYRNGVRYESGDGSGAVNGAYLTAVFPKLNPLASVTPNCNTKNILQLKLNYGSSAYSGFTIYTYIGVKGYSGGSKDGQVDYQFYRGDDIKFTGQSVLNFKALPPYTYPKYDNFLGTYFYSFTSYSSNDYMYEIYPYKDVNGNRYYADRTTFTTGCGKSTNGVASPTNVAATDGLYSNKVVVSWKYGSTSGISKFNVYRNDTLFASPNSNQTFVNDNDAVPGRKYYYHVTAVDNNNTESWPETDFGYKKENGTIKGSVLTQVGNAGVRNVKVVATAFIDGENYKYETTTNTSGDYIFNNVYYAEKATYSVQVTLPGHEFVKSVQSAELLSNTNTVNLQPFYDKTAYVLSGNIRRQDVTCGLDSVKVVLKIKKPGTTETEKEIYTDEKGNYSFVYDPFEGLTSLRVIPATQKIIGQGADADTILFNFSPAFKEYTNFSNPNKVETQHFDETTRYPVNISVGNTCGILPGTNKFYVNITSQGGCYNQTILTDGQGKKTVYLPPFAYTMHVMDVEPLTAANLPILRYINPRPQSIDLLDLEKELGSDKLKAKTDVNVDFIYHKTPVISYTGGLNNFLCNDPAKPSIIQQNSTVSINLSVEETHDGSSCHINEGYILVKNNAAVQKIDTVFYDAKTKKFPAYEFVAGEPNIISPHVHYVIFEYYTESGGFQGDLIKAILVEGVKAAPGNDIIVENDKEGAQVQMPLFVLRDPPGDASQSYIEKGTKFTRTLTVSDDNKGFAGLKAESKTLFGGVGFAVDLSSKAGGGTGQGASFEVSGETTQRIETSDNSMIHNKNSTNWLTGTSADVIVGAGLAMQYGIAQQIKISGCDVVNEFIITTSPSNIKTTWIYTMDQITGLRDEYKMRIDQVKNGTLRIEGKNSGEAIAYFTALQKNWEQIIEYHDKQTVPYYNLCDVANYANVPEPFKTQVNEWVASGFCNQIGSYADVKGKKVFTLNDKIVWNTELLDKYNKISQLVRLFTSRSYQLDFPGGLTFSGSNLSNLKLDNAYLSQYGSDAENITFSGASSISKQVAVSKSSASSYKQNWFFESDNFVGLAVDGEVKTSTGFALGSFFSITIPAFKFEDKYGVTFGYTHEFEREATSETNNTATVGYVLSDDDPGDQFSVTAIRGIDPTHTPYFALLGGRSSCPSEPGAIQRDVPLISFEYPDGTGFNPNLYEQDPDEPVQIPIKISSANPFGESRWIQLYAQENINQNNAIMSVGGTRLGTIDYFVPAGGSVYAYLTVTRNPLYFQHKDLGISLRPPCDQYYNYSDYAAGTFSIEYRSPCSNVSILTDNNWIINKADSGKQESLVVELGDYNLKNDKLQEIKVQYRRRGSNKWNNAVVLSRDSLISYYKTFQTSPNQLPSYFYVWDITDQADIIDGEYDVRAVAVCGIYGDISGNTITGTIDRSQIRLFGQPQPSDGLLSLGEEVSVTFNKQIDCAALKDAVITLRKKSDSSIVKLNYTCFGNSLMWDKDTSVLLQLQGETIIASVDGVKDFSGNSLRQPITWEFEISNNPVYWNPRKLVLNVYKGRKDTLRAQLLNTTAGNYTYVLSGNDPWLKLNSPTGTVQPNGANVSFYIDANTMNIGNYRDTVTASLTGFTDIVLPVEVNVYPIAPEWKVNAAEFTNSINVLANFTINNGSASTDSLDKVAVSIGDQVRGVANIKKYGKNNNYLAYITIYGNASDVNKPLDFRVWDASAGIEYDAYLVNNDTIKFSVGNNIYGSILNPRALKVSTSQDSVRYIPLNKGWTWISLNTESVKMDVNSLMKSISPTSGDLVKTLSTTSEFVSGKGWVTLNGLKNMSSDSGYMIKLAKADTLRLSGKNASINPLFMPSGWSMIGYPQQVAKSVNSVLVTDPAPSAGDILKNDIQTAQYDKNNGGWVGSLTQMQPNKAYLLKLGKASTVEMLKRSNDDTSGWNLRRNGYEYNMTITGRIEINGARLKGFADRVAAFVGDECRGTGKLIFVPELGTYRLSMFVYSNTPGEKITFKILDSDAESIYDDVHEVSFKADSIVGNLISPFVFSNMWATGVKITKTADLRMQVYPNPFSSYIALTFGDDKSNKYQLTLIDALGREVYRQSYISTNGDNKLNLDVNSMNLKDGFYLLRLESAKKTSVIKLVKNTTWK